MTQATRQTVDQETAHAIGVEAYTFLYPLVLMETTRAQMTNVEHVGDAIGRGPANTFVHVRQFPPGDFRDVVRPNFDTLYSIAWLDLREEPLVVSVPDAGDGYYLLPLYDMWGEVFATIGTRTTGNGAGDFAIVPPGWEGRLPGGLRRLPAPHTMIWIIGRTEASPATYDDVHAFQDEMALTPLSRWGEEPPAVSGRHDDAIDDRTPPLRQVDALSPRDFLAHASRLLQAYPPHFNDQPMLARMARLGFDAGGAFDLAAAEPVVREALEQAVPAARERITARQKQLGRHRNGWVMMTEAIGAYGTDYLARACVELIGLGANLPEDAIYPLAYVDGDGAPLSGAQRYVLRFAHDALPPVRAFWSLTLYDVEGFQVPNPLDRFAIGDRDALAFGLDGSLELLVQHDEPLTADERANWLPAPTGGFNLCLRLYSPEPAALDGTWTPPAVAKRS